MGQMHAWQTLPGLDVIVELGRLRGSPSRILCFCLPPHCAGALYYKSLSSSHKPKNADAAGAGATDAEKLPLVHDAAAAEAKVAAPVELLK